MPWKPSTSPSRLAEKLGRHFGSQRGGLSRLLRNLRHLLKGQIDGGEAHKAVILIHGGAVLFDLILHVAQGALQGDDVLHHLCFRQKGLEPLLLGAQGLQTGLGVIVLGADVLCALCLTGQVAQLPCILQKPV